MYILSLSKDADIAEARRTELSHIVIDNILRFRQNTEEQN